MKRTDGLSGKLADSISKIVIAILVLLPFHALLSTWLGNNVGHFDLIRIWKEIVIAVVAGPTLYLAWRSAKLRHWLLRSWVVRLYLLYVLVHLVVGAWALHTGHVNKVAFIYALLINLRFIGFFIICYILARLSKSLYRNWLKILFIPAAGVVVFGLLQRFFLPYDFLRHFGYGPNTIPAYQTIDANIHYRRIQSTLRGANPLGAYMLLVMTAAASALSKYRRLMTLGLIGGLVVLFFSYSRSAWVGTAISLSLLAYWALSKRDLSPRVWLLGLLTLLIVAGGAYALKDKQQLQDTLFHTSSSSTSAKSSNAARSSAIKRGISDVWHQPLGRGPGTAGPASTRNNHPPRIAENYFIQIGQEVGILGTLVFIVINCLIAYQLWVRRHDQLAKVLLASLAGITFVNLVSHAWADDTLSLLWWGLTGVAVSIPVILKTKDKQDG